MFGEYGKLESLESARYWCYGALLLQRTFRGSMENTAPDIWYFEWCSRCIGGKKRCYLVPLLCLVNMVSWNHWNRRGIDATVHYYSRERFVDRWSISHATTMARNDADKPSEATKFVKAHLALPLPHSIWTCKQKSKYHNTTINHRDDATQHNTTTKSIGGEESLLAAVHNLVIRDYICTLDGRSKSCHSRLYLRFERGCRGNCGDHQNYPSCTARHVRMYAVLVFGRIR